MDGGMYNIKRVVRAWNVKECETKDVEFTAIMGYV